MRRLRFPTRTLSVRRRRGIVALALLAVLARALVPAGFMPVAGDGTMQMVMCEGHMHHHPAPDGGGPGTPPSHDSPCPYAASAGPGLLQALPGICAAAVAHATTLDVPESSLPCETPPRHTAPRGPPAIV